MKSIKNTLLAILVVFSLFSCKDDRLKALIVTGRDTPNFHNWEQSHQILKTILTNSGRFVVDVAISPENANDMSGFRPSFNKYDVVVVDYIGDDWSPQTQQDFETFVAEGGGLVIYHATNNGFPNWKAFNQMTGLGGWGDRDEKSGPYVYYRNDSLVYDNKPGPGGSHPPQHEFVVTHRKPEHPILMGLPAKWMQSRDELYSELRGPAENMEVLATAYADPKKGGTGKDEPVLMTIKYGKGRVFHTALGHVGKERPLSVQSAGFIITLQRGAEWAATGMVTQALPPDLPNAATPFILPEYRFYSFDELLQKAGRFEYGNSSTYLKLISGRLRNAAGNKELLKKAEQNILKTVAGEATDDAKNYLCRELSWMGSEDCIPVLQSLQENEGTRDMAKYAITRINKN